MLSDKELEIIRRKLTELEEEPPANSFHKIQSDLNNDRNHSIFWWLAAACLFIGLLTFIGLHVPDLQTKPVPEIQAETNQQPGAEENFSSPGKAGKQASNPAKGHQVIPDQTQQSLARESGLNNSETSQLTRPQVARTRRMGESKFKSNVKLSGQTAPEKRVGRKPADRVKPGKSEMAATGEDPVPAMLQNQPAPATAAIRTKPDNTGKGDSLQNKLKSDSLAVKANLAAADSSNKPASKGWSLGFLISPRYASKVFLPNAADNIFITRLNNKNKVTPDRKGIELGLQVSRALNNKIDLNLGLSWLKAKENISYTYSNGTIDTVQYVQVGATSMVVKPVERLETRAFITSYSYGGGQLGLTYNFWSGSSSKLGVSLSAGGNLLLKSKTRYLVNGELYPALTAQEEDSLMNKSNYNLALGLAYTRKLGKGFEIRVMPALSYFLKPVYTPQHPYKIQPYFLNLNIVLIRRFKRE